MPINPDSPVGILPKIGDSYSKLLEKLNILSVRDLVFHTPFRYDDFSKRTTSKHLVVGEAVTLIGEVTSVGNALTKNRKKITKATISDDHGKVDAIWFNQFYIAQNIKKGDKIALSGKPQFFAQKVVFSNPEYEHTNEDMELKNTGRIVPVYPETYGITSKWLRTRIEYVLTNNLLTIKDPIPSSITQKNKLLPLEEAMIKIHFPKSWKEINEARNRFGYQELFEVIHEATLRREEWKTKKVAKSFDSYKKDLKELIDNLPFKLTPSQAQALDEITSDLVKESPMNRLLQGDVGSGKTIIALLASYLCYLNGRSSYIMAPTEILAKQHYETFKKMLNPLGLTVSLITGGNKEDITNINIGTHALLFDKNTDNKMGLVVIDEQHKFGVAQRAEIAKKIEELNPHVLTMTATPIPRTLALTILGDLKLSYLSEKPAGRELITTWVIDPTKRKAAYEWLKNRIMDSNYEEQAFVVCPLIEESESESLSNIKAATTEFETLAKTYLTGLKLGLIHGKLTSKEKNTVMQDFKDKKINVLIATPVIEVGIDIPASTTVIIEAAERFGLASLHQIRGRVGRSDKKSYCILVSESKNPKTLERLKLLEKHPNGLTLAEEDLKLRGPGEIAGKLQHGKVSFKFADITDIELVKTVKDDVEEVIKQGNGVQATKHLKELKRDSGSIAAN